MTRIHEVALGIAVGITCGLGVFGLTAFHIVGHPARPALDLLSQYFRGYTVTWPGAVVGLAWGGFAGFVSGWLLAKIHNLTISAWLLVARTRAELTQHRNFLDRLR